MKHRKPLPHFCNEPLRCPECIQRFWIWAENHTQGRGMRESEKGSAPPGIRTRVTFYEAAAKR